ncbi:MAG TPA: uroporphyrinogen-III C-methyltransferase [Candidatus Limnocylindria bacterium]|jgi:uroporphyrin-III C-methyltransferase|nr:uroporphyrinogen-III C-methyltransferase [Candidatus Limnocylindria bacterium]
MTKGKVYLVGAGPGDPDLLTVRALRLLRTADIVFHDDLVSPQILGLIPSGTHVESVGKRCGHASVTQQQIHSLLINSAREGWEVVRLKSGDPLVFGRAGEEMEALRQAGIEFEVVPGITAAFGVAAQARIPLTDRRLASKIVFLSNHRCASKTVPDWKDAVSKDATILVYMPGAHYESLTAKLRATGLEAQTPCLLVSHATSAQQRVHPTTLTDLPKSPRLPAPVLLVIGAVAGQYSREAVDADMSDGLSTPTMTNNLAITDALVELHIDGFAMASRTPLSTAAVVDDRRDSLAKP